MPSWQVTADDPKLHNRQLTSLRGVACLVVLVGHVIQVIDYRLPSPGSFQRISREIVTSAFNAEGAVLLFFVLSGCVLAMSLRNVTIMNGRVVLGFYIKRVFRLYPLIWLATGFSVFSVITARHLAQDGIFIPWLARNLHAQVSLPHILASLAGVWTKYDGPMWSLRVELIYSALFPIIYLVVKNQKSRGWFIGALLIIALLPGVPSQLGTTFGLSFALGALIPMLPRNAGRFDAGIAFAALLILLYDRLLLGAFHPPEVVYDIIETSASFIIVRDIYVRGHRYAFLAARYLARLGELSFSIYLLHLPILLLIFTALEHYVGLPMLLDHPNLTPLALTLLTVTVTISISALTYRFMELPLHNVGRGLGTRIARGRAVAVERIILDESIAGPRPNI
jgi:peptidoglycan/LPS O-acetylase OafA/YrhL